MKINIVGAGINGLSVAYFMAKQGHKVTVFDPADEVGGISGFFPVEGTSLEKYYHHIFSGHDELIALMHELGVGDKVYFQKTKMGFYFEGHIYPFASAKDLLSFTPMKIIDRMRLGLSSLMMMQVKDWRTMEEKSALEWLRVYSGKESCRIIWEPLLRMKFGNDYDRISAAWLWNRVVDRKKAKGNSTEKEALGYVRGGYKILFDALLEQVKSHGGKILTKTPVDEIIVKDGKCTGVRSSDTIYSGDAVLATVSIPTFLKMTPQLPDEYIERTSSIRYQNSVCVVLKLTKSLSDYYWINISDPDSPFVGIIEHTKLLSPENYGNYNLVYLTKYTSSDDPMNTKPDEEVCEIFIERLKQIFPDVADADIKESWVFRDRDSQPIFVKNYSKLMPEIATPISHLYLLNTSQLYPESRCLNSGILKSKEAVKKILADNGE